MAGSNFNDYQFPSWALKLAVTIASFAVAFNIYWISNTLLSGQRLVGKGENRRYVEISSEPNEYFLHLGIDLVGLFVAVWLLIIFTRRLLRSRNN